MFEEMNAEMMEIMVDDFIADASGEYDDLILHRETAHYNEEIELWTMEAEDDKFDYTLAAYPDGVIRIYYSDTK